MNKDLSHKQDFSFVLSTIKQAQQKVYLQVNKALLELNWQVGKYVSKKVASEQWGKAIIEDLSKYILENEPKVKGFSARNIWTMKQFYETYSYLGEKLPTLLAEIEWSHNRRIMSLKIPEEREFYLKLCAKNKYSFRELERLINTGTFERTILANENNIIKNPKGSNVYNTNVRHRNTTPMGSNHLDIGMFYKYANPLDCFVNNFKVVVI